MPCGCRENLHDHDHYICVSATLESRVLEYVDHLHEHFLDPVVIRDGWYMPPERPGYSITMHPETLVRFRFPDGAAWTARAPETHRE